VAQVGGNDGSAGTFALFRSWRRLAERKGSRSLFEPAAIKMRIIALFPSSIVLAVSRESAGRLLDTPHRVDDVMQQPFAPLTAIVTRNIPAKYLARSREKENVPAMAVQCSARVSYRITRTAARERERKRGAGHFGAK